MHNFFLAKELYILIFAAASWIAIWLKKRRSESWPITSGRVETAYTSGEYGHVAELGYSYSSNGEYYSGLYQRKFSTESAAEKFLDSVRNQSVMIRYQPDRPDNSILRERDNAALFHAC
ncbi:MAG: hypothetical protein ROO76_11140 [Terriglobia bacterium]|jgi:hypothetical protein|nr:hypothetical protein [Terriglobia bacterium]